MKNTILFWFLCMGATVASVASAQEGPPPAERNPIDKAEADSEAEAEPDGVLIEAVELRGKVRDMRRSVLGGGPAVEKAEREALSFYRKKISQNARRIDELRTQRDAKDAEYRLALDSTLEAKNKETSEASARKAATLRAEIEEIDVEIDELSEQRDRISAAVAAIQARMNRRKRILDHFETPEEITSMPFLGEDVLGPDEGDLVGGDPFADSAFLADLLRRDPAQARRILFDRDPMRYWKLFPLTPPVSSLHKAIPFPPADLPGNR